MNLTDYQSKAATFAVYPKDDMEYLPAGLLNEAGEVMGVIKKQKRGDKVDPDKLAFELGDLMWYGAMICNEHGIDMSLEGTTIPMGYANLKTDYQKAKALITIAMRITDFRDAIVMTPEIKTSPIRLRWHTAELLYVIRDLAGIPLEKIADYNITKLTARKAAGVIHGSGHTEEERKAS